MVIMDTLILDFNGTAFEEVMRTWMAGREQTSDTDQEKKTRQAA